MTMFKKCDCACSSVVCDSEEYTNVNVREMSSLVLSLSITFQNVDSLGYYLK